MKKFILPLILILFLTFTLIGNCDWLSGWDYRIEISLPDYAGDIGGEVVWFPVDVFLTSEHCQEVFTELTTDAEYNLMQFTQSDGTSLLYGHMKLFDVSEKKGIFTVSADGWTIDANTSVFLYYDKDHAVNDTYIGAINTAACEAVYNDEYAAVYDMADGVDNEHIYDCTSNNNDGTKKDANQPIEATGKVGQCQDFDGGDDWIFPDGLNADMNPSAGTISTIIKGDNVADTQIWFGHYNDATNPYRAYVFTQGSEIGWKLGSDNVFHGTGIAVSESWQHVVLTWDGTNGRMYIDGVIIDGATATYSNLNAFVNKFAIGQLCADFGNLFYDGICDEISASSINRSAAWIKGTYNSLWDTLFTYGSEEEAPAAGITWNGITIIKWNTKTITTPINTQ